MSFIKRVTQLAVLVTINMIASCAYADDTDQPFYGQTIVINTELHSFVGKPTWEIIVRDIDNEENLPQIYNLQHGSNHWVIRIPSRNYLVIASRVQISNYRGRYNDFTSYTLDDFCHLESHGHIARGESLIVTLTGDLTPDMDKIHCDVMKIKDPGF